jgi:hypothetical protein
MARYIVLNTHTPQECEPMKADLTRIGPELKGATLMCTCPDGEHGYYLVLEGETAEQVLGSVPASLKLGKTRAVRLQVMDL